MGLEVYEIEIVFISAIICIQVIIAIFLFGSIVSYKSIFNVLPTVIQKEIPNSLYQIGNVKEILAYDKDGNDHEEAEMDLSTITLLVNSSNNNILDKIIHQINSYLINNKGAVIDFHLIKDITDRNVEVEENSINSRIPAPLYLGLAGTMFGIIFGLFAIDFDVTKDAIQAIQPLIDGVKAAMFASVVGIVITTIFSVRIFKNASYKAEEGKNDFLSKLLSDLLPKINRSKLPEVEILSNKLDLFARNTTDSITKFNEIVKNSSNAIQYEQQLIRDIKQLDVAKISVANVKMFSQLEQMMGSFENFAGYYNKLNKSMGQTSNLLENLREFVARTNHINDVLTEVKEMVGQSKDATDFFNKHIKSFAQYNNAVNESVGTTDSVLQKAIDELKLATLAQIESYNIVVSGHDQKMTVAFDRSIETFSKEMEEQALRAIIAYDDSIPKFKKLEQLDKLGGIENRLAMLESKLSETFTSNTNKLIAAIGGTNIQLPDFNQEKTEGIKNKRFGDYIVSSLKVCAYLIVIGIGVFLILQYFKVVS